MIDLHVDSPTDDIAEQLRIANLIALGLVKAERVGDDIKLNIAPEADPTRVVRALFGEAGERALE